MPAVLSKFFVDDFEKFYERMMDGVIGKATGDKDSGKWWMRMKYTREHIRQVYDRTMKEQHGGGWKTDADQFASKIFGVKEVNGTITLPA
tara:strand:- start:63 stop:332 length:270 start_codon:yes stop_codon:yes gene_type:complete